MRAMPLLAFLPEEVIVILLILGGFAVMFQAKKMAAALFTMAGLMIVLPVILEPLLEMLPEWALYLIIIVFFSQHPSHDSAYGYGERSI